MQVDEWIDPDVANETAYDDLIVSVEASQGIMSILLAVCDDEQLREKIIQRYEAEFQPNIRPYRIMIPHEDPSLRQAISQLVTHENSLQEGRKVVLTVTGAEQLSFLKLGQAQSEQDVFFGYLQWTREGLREFRFPIILWITNQLLGKISRKAPDFWSWRKDVFRFISKKTQIVQQEDINELLPAFRQLGFPDVMEDDEIPIQDLEKLIAVTEVRQSNDPLLATLYSSLGRIYAQRIERGEAQDYAEEAFHAIELFKKAIALQEAQRQELDLAFSLTWLGHLYEFQGQYAEAELLFARSLSIRKQQLGENHLDVATSLNNLAGVYCEEGRYTEAESFYLQSLSIREQQLGSSHLDVSDSLNNLALLYSEEGRYAEAETIYMRSLSIREQQLGIDHPDVSDSLNNLALLYFKQGRYSETESLYKRSLSISEQQLGVDHPDVANCLNNLAGLYQAQGRYAEAEPLYVRSLKICETTLGADHPNTNTVRENLATLHQKLRN